MASVIERAIELGAQRDDREGNQMVFQHLEHLFDPELDEQTNLTQVSNILRDLAMQAIQQAIQIGIMERAPRDLDDLHEQAEHIAEMLPIIMAGAALHGMVVGVHSQRLYEAETREGLDDLLNGGLGEEL